MKSDEYKIIRYSGYTCKHILDSKGASIESEWCDKPPPGAAPVTSVVLSPWSRPTALALKTAARNHLFQPLFSQRNQSRRFLGLRHGEGIQSAHASHERA